VRIVIAFLACCLSVAAYSFVMSNGIVVGALIGLPNRVADIALAQKYAREWLYVALLFQVIAIVILAPLVPPADDDDSRVLRAIVRFFVSTVMCVGAAVLLGTVGLYTIAAFHHSVVPHH